MGAVTPWSANPVILDLMRSASKWRTTANVLVWLSAIGSLILGSQIAKDCSGFTCYTDPSLALGWAIAFFAGSLVPILPLYGISRLLRGQAQTYEMLTTTQTPRPSNPSAG